MRMQILMSMACVVGAVACGGSDANQQAANDPSTVQATSTTSGSVTAPIVTAGSTTNQENNAINPDPSNKEGAVATNAGAGKNFSGSTISPVATGATSAQLGATPIAPSASASAQLTPMTQGTAKTDTHITASIRKQITADRSLSSTAKSVKVITNGTKVQLRGSVKSDSEKSTIESDARNTAGVTDVDDQIQVNP